MHSLILLLLIAYATALPSGFSPSVNIQNGTLVGTSNGIVDSWLGIPYAEPPTGTLRLRLPRTLASSFGTFTATATPRACAQLQQLIAFGNSVDPSTAALANLAWNQTVQNFKNAGEDCLTLNLQRPAGTRATSSFPVVVWFFGGGFEFGASTDVDGSSVVTKSISLGREVLYVAANYRLGGFGFLGGQDLKDEGNTNLGLHDQRLVLQWVQDNIAAFGGDPSRVTIWGESAGSISVFDHTIINNGDHTYKGKPLFRAAIMNSGSLAPAYEVASARVQAKYDHTLEAAGCSNYTTGTDRLACLRSLDYQTFLTAANSIPSIFTVSQSYLPHPDNSSAFFTNSPEMAVESGRFAKVPIIIGDQEDEGTLFALLATNLTDTASLIRYLNAYFPSPEAPAILTALVATYPDNLLFGSPYGTGFFNEIYPQFKRLSAVLGDIAFTLTRRSYLSVVAPVVPTWSFLASYFYGTAVLGTFHGSDLVAAYQADGLLSPVATDSILTYYISFINYCDPNVISTIAPLTRWPQWNESPNNPQLLNFGTLGNFLMPDTFRSSAASIINNNIAAFRV